MISRNEASRTTLRRARLDDLAELVRMRVALQAHLKAANALVWTLEPHGAAAVAANYRELLTRGAARAAIQVAETPGRPGLTGMAMGRVMERPEFTPSVTGLVDDVWVEPALRGHGIAKALLADVVAFFQGHRAETVVLDYVIGNREAEGLWRGLGFRPVQIGADARLADLAAALKPRSAT